MQALLSALKLPLPDAYASAHSEKLRHLITQKINAAGGKISFAEFMQLALYAPGLGYYVAGARKLGAQGDFTTAPEISPLFSQCLANQCAEVLHVLSCGSILEFGAGTGVMAADLLLHLETLACLPEHYYILEVSPDLKQRQQETIKAKCPHLLNRVRWLNELPQEKIRGITLANEVLDAMPVEVFIADHDQFKQGAVRIEEGEFVLVADNIAEPHLLAGLQNLVASDISFQDGYQSEINLHVKPWLSGIEHCLEQGVVLLIDYGYSRAEYYHPQRSHGTLKCYYQQRAHNNPFLLLGLQDITAHVDFTAVAEAAVELGFDIMGFTNQGSFLLANNLLDLNMSADNVERFNLNQQIKQLTLPSEMGEAFKVLALGKNYEQLLSGFSGLDLLHQL